MKYKTPESKEGGEEREILCEDTKEKVVGYKNYLKTNHGKDVRIAIYRKFDRHCYDCKKAIELRDANIHHLTYERVGHESVDDLVLLCIECHKKRHGRQTKHRTKKSGKEKTYKKKTK